MTTFFGFGIADGMFSPEVLTSRKPLTPEEARALISEGVEVCLNPSHAATIAAMNKRYDIKCEIPEKAPIVKLETGDQFLVMSPRGLPRLENRHEYTSEEIDKASFAFGLWTIL